ncbi:MAG: hypothetical protein KatS3mg110_2325 [Pirellulaceae bacterium]|nr:MAG: hypothetical protein KatS3mg110_2325 [Pirellulaceae bacterium]
MHRAGRWILFSGAVVPLCLLVILPGCARKLPADVSPRMDVVREIRQALGSGTAATESTASTAEPTGFATFEGVFRVVGTPPPRTPLPVSGGDAGYCAPGGKAPLSEQVVVGPNGGLANVLVTLDMKIPDTWIHPDYAATANATLTGDDAFDQKGCVFLSHVFAMRATQTVEIRNSDDVSHNTNLAGKGRARVENRVIPAHGSFLYAPGGPSGVPFDVSCNIHPWMKAYMYVADHPYFAVTDEEGKFRIENVPAGVELQFKVWKEVKPSDWSGVTVNGAPGNWSRGRFKVTLQPGETLQWQVQVDAATLQ